MSSEKKLKKEIKMIYSDLKDECATYKYFHPELSQKKFVEINFKLDQKLNEVIYDINHLKYAGNIKPSRYFNGIINKVKNEMIPILDELIKI